MVVGDIIEFREGDQVPADVRLIEASRLEVDEAALTGESVPVHKTTSKLEDPEGTMAIGDRTNMAFRQVCCTFSPPVLDLICVCVLALFLPLFFSRTLVFCV